MHSQTQNTSINTETVKSFFDNTETYLHANSTISIRKKIIRKLCGDIKGKTILDAGCGDGSISMQFINENKITFQDISSKMMEIVKKSIPEAYRGNALFCTGDLYNANFTEPFDFILAIGLLAHVPDVDKYVSVVRSKLNENGTLLIQYTDAANLLTRFNKFVSVIFRRDKRHYKKNKITKRSISNILTSNGFVISEEIQYWSTIPGSGILPVSVRENFERFLQQSWPFSKMGGEYILQCKKK